MKKVFLIISMLLFGFLVSNGQNATLRIDDYTGLNPGDHVLVGLYIDYIDNSGTANCDGAEFYVEYDPTVLTVLNQTVNLHPNVPSYFWNTNVPNPGDWRGLFTNFGPPIVLNSGDKWCDIEFVYNGPGGSEVNWGNSNKDVGGKHIKGITILVVPGNTPYNLTLINGSVNMGGAANWTGAVSSDWFATGNWSTGAIPTATDDVVIPAGMPNDPSIATFVADCQNMQIDAGATLHIMDDGALTAAGTITNDGHIMMHGTNIGASLMENGLAGTGTFEYDRTLTSGPTGTHFGWHYISSPLDNSVTGDLVSYWVKSFDPASGMFVDIDPWGDFNGILCDDEDYSTGTVALNVMQGYSVKRDLDYLGGAPCPQGTVPANDDIIEFGADVMNGLGPWGEFAANATNLGTMANVNTGPYSMGVNPQWNLLGNPYPSGLDWDAVTLPAGVNNGVYFWDESAAQYASYVNGVGTNGGTNEIPPTQGFFVEATGAATLTFDNTMRIHSVAPYYKEEVNDVVKLQVSANGYTDETAIRFVEGTNLSWDKAYDAKKLKSTGEGIPSLYTTSAGLELSINTQPAADLVPMAFSCDQSGTYTIEATETSDFANVVLEDTYTGVETDLLIDSYTFDYVAGSDPNRFIVHFTPLGTPELEANSIRIWSSERNIYVSVPETVTGDVAVYNMMGQEVVANKVIPGMNVIPVNDVNTYYVVKVMSGSNVKTEKVFIK